MVEKRWKAFKDGTQTVKNRHLLQATKKDPNSHKQYEKVSQAFTSKDGKTFYSRLISNDSGNYWLNLEEI